MPKVSVIIPCYNYGQYVMEAIDSVLKQTYQDFEILVINDGSTDPATNELLKNLNLPKTRVIWQNNQGLSASRNNGIALAQGEYYLPLDADDFIEPYMLEQCVKYLDEHQEIAFVYGDTRFFGNINMEYKTFPYNAYQLLYTNIPSVSSVIRKKVFDDGCRYNSNMKYGYEDWDFWQSLLEKGYTGQLIPQIFLNYRRHGRSMAKEAIEKHLFLCEQLKKNHPALYTKEKIKQLKKEWYGRLSAKAKYKIFIRKLLNQRTKYNPIILLAQYLYNKKIV